MRLMQKSCKSNPAINHSCTVRFSHPPTTFFFKHSLQWLRILNGVALLLPRRSLFGISVNPANTTQLFHLVHPDLLFSSTRSVFFICSSALLFLALYWCQSHWRTVYFIYSSFLFDLYFSAHSARHLSPGSESPPWTALRISPLHALPIALSPLFPPLFFPELVCTSITHMQYLFAVTPLGTHTNTVAHAQWNTRARTDSFLHQITALFSLQSPFSPRGTGALPHERVISGA